MREQSDFDRLFRQYYAELFVFARRMVWSEDDCHDIVTDAYEMLWRHFARIDGSTARAWLYRTVRNSCIDHIEHARHERDYAELYRRITSPVDDGDWVAERDERAKALGTVLGLMDDKTRGILHACYVERKKYREVAEEMGISTSTVKKYIMRALKIIREANLKNHKAVSFR